MSKKKHYHNSIYRGAKSSPVEIEKKVNKIHYELLKRLMRIGGGGL
ncbi:hypothetical protein [Kosmotoga pacifica]|nr:hypothetical protein [Kosmotoga pacifica]